MKALALALVLAAGQAMAKGETSTDRLVFHIYQNLTTSSQVKAKLPGVSVRSIVIRIFFLIPRRQNQEFEGKKKKRSCMLRDPTCFPHDPIKSYLYQNSNIEVFPLSPVPFSCSSPILRKRGVAQDGQEQRWTIWGYRKEKTHMIDGVISLEKERLQK